MTAELLNHIYFSTACQHMEHHKCREQCKFCDARCMCACHMMSKEQMGVRPNPEEKPEMAE